MRQQLLKYFYGRIDIVVLNSGIYENRPAVNTTMERVRELMEVNYLSFVALSKAILPHMMHSKHGKVKFSISSLVTTSIMTQMVIVCILW